MGSLSWEGGKHTGLETLDLLGMQKFKRQGWVPAGAEWMLTEPVSGPCIGVGGRKKVWASPVLLCLPSGSEQAGVMTATERIYKEGAGPVWVELKQSFSWVSRRLCIHAALSVPTGPSAAGLWCTACRFGDGVPHQAQK